VQFALTPEQSLLKETVEACVRDHAGSSRRGENHPRSAGPSGENWRALAEIGVFGVAFATEDGGLGGGPRELVTVMESLGNGLCTEPVLEEIVLAGGLLARAGHKAQKEAWLPRLIRGEAHLALAHFEHAARFEPADVRLRAETRGEKVFLEGEKSVVPLAASADRWIVSASEGGNSRDAKRVGLYLVTPTAPGVERRDFHLIDGSSASSLRFSGVQAEGRLRGGLEELSATLDEARLAAGAEMVGIMSSLFSTTVDYLKTRRQFGQPLSSFQVLQHRLADLYVRLEQSRSQLYRAAACMGASEEVEGCVAGMKSYISRAAIEMGEECVHLHGGIGTTDDLPIGHGYKRLILLANLFGDANSELARFNRLQSRYRGRSRAAQNTVLDP